MHTIPLDQIQRTIEQHLPDAKVQVNDLTGTGDHIQVHVVAAAFEGKTPIQRHRMIYAMFPSDVGGAIHALSIQARTPNEIR